jgi:energy-coupling factor transporter ATP-binding protein EcfA2
VPVVSPERAIVLSGAVGSGKTTLLLQIAAVMEERGEPYALIDLDWLAWVHPAAGSERGVGELLVENLRAVWGAYRGAGVRRLAMARHLEHAGQLTAVRGALPGVELLAVHLAVPAAVLEQRLRRREAGPELSEHLAMLAAGAGATPFEDAVVDNDDDRPAREVALEILRLAGWT